MTKSPSFLILRSGELTPESAPCCIAGDAASGAVLALEPKPPSGPDSKYLVSADDTALRLMALPKDRRLGDVLTRASSSQAASAGFDAWVEDVSYPGPGGKVPAMWQDVATQARSLMGDEGAIIAILGAKKVGKSTFARVLVNTLLRNHREVAFLETDCGQVEFGVPGLLTLSIVSSPMTGPPFLHDQATDGRTNNPNQETASIIASAFVGDVSPASGSARYVRCITALHEAYKRLLPSSVPLVVNTHGWTRGVGQDVLAALLCALCPNFVFQVSSGEPRKDLPDGPWWRTYTPSSATRRDTVADSFDEEEGGEAMAGVSSEDACQTMQEDQPHYWLLPPIYASSDASSSCFRPMSPVELRAAQWVNWTRRCARSMGVAVEESAAPADLLATAVPYVAQWDGITIESLFTRRLSPDQQAVALNGAVVGLSCSCDDKAGQESACCLGVGIVRAVDGQSRTVYLLTDLAPEQLSKVDTLQLGRLELPGQLLQSPSFRSPYMALHCLPTLGTGSGKSKSRNNLLRVSQLNKQQQ